MFNNMETVNNKVTDVPVAFPIDIPGTVANNGVNKPKLKSAAYRRRLKNMRTKRKAKKKATVNQNISTNNLPKFSPEEMFKMNKQVPFLYNTGGVLKPGPSTVPTFPGKGIKVAIIAKGYPNKTVTEEDIDAIRSALVDLIDQSVKAPQFESSRVMDGYYGLICADIESFKITKNFFDKNTPWTVVEAAALSKSEQVIGFFPETTSEGIDITISRLGKQNPRLNVKNWDILDYNLADNGLYVTLKVDKQSVDELKRIQWKPYYMLYKATFKIFEGYEA